MIISVAHIPSFTIFIDHHPDLQLEPSPMKRKTAQLELLKKEKLAFGGDLMTTRQGRRGSRPLATRNSMHLVLRSSQARGAWSFARPNHKKKIDQIVRRFSQKYGVRVLSLANVGNHLHFHIQLTNLLTYKPFIRAITAAIAMAVTGYSRWKKRPVGEKSFWDRRPFTRVIAGGRRAFLAVRDYVRINKLEGFGFQRAVAAIIVREESTA